MWRSVVVYICVAGLVLGVPHAFAQELASESAGNITAALKELSTVVGIAITSKEQARETCNREKYLEVCTQIGKKYQLYNADEAKKVNTLLEELKGETFQDLSRCTTTDCMLQVAERVVRTVGVKNPELGKEFELTDAAVDKKKALVAAAHDAGTTIDACRMMDPDTASVELLRSCAKLARDSRVRGGVSGIAYANVEALDHSAALRAALERGQYVCGDGTLEGCGNFCLNPGPEARARGIEGIPQVCTQIAKEFFGVEGVQQLEAAYTHVGEAEDFYTKKAEHVIFTKPDGSITRDPREVGRFLEEEGKQGNVEEVRRGMDFMVANGFAQPEDKNFALKFVEKIQETHMPFDFDRCRAHPEGCREFVPDEHRENFDATQKTEGVMREEKTSRMPMQMEGERKSENESRMKQMMVPGERFMQDEREIPQPQMPQKFLPPRQFMPHERMMNSPTNSFVPPQSVPPSPFMPSPPTFTPPSSSPAPSEFFVSPSPPSSFAPRQLQPILGSTHRVFSGLFQRLGF